MSNTRHATGLPAALARDGKPVPPSADVAEASLADIIGEAVALHLGNLLAGLMARPGCIVCAAAAKRAEREYERDAAIRRQAAEAIPNPPDLSVTESCTIGARGPVCWEHYSPDADGPKEVPVSVVFSAPDGE